MESSHNEHDNITPAALLEQLVYVDTFLPEIEDQNQLDDTLAAELSAFADESFIFPDEEKPTNGQDDRNRITHSENNIGIKHEGNDGKLLASGSNESNGHHLHTDALLGGRFDNLNNGFNQDKPANALEHHSIGNGISNIISPLNPLQNNQSSTLSSTTASSYRNPGTSSATSATDLLSVLPKVRVPPGAQSSLIAAGLTQTQIDALAALVAQHQGVPKHESSVDASPSNSNFQPLIPDSNSSFLDAHNGHGGSVNPQATTTSPPFTSLQSNGNNSSMNPLTSSTSPLSANGSASSRTRSNSIKPENSADAELDKRRRNTAASARFRIKKKLKEQQLERSVRELNELTITLEKKIQTLEMENRLLRNLVVEKGEQRNNEELELLKQRAKLVSNSNYNEEK